MKKFIAALLLSCLSITASAQIIIALLFGDKLNTGKMEFGVVVSPARTNISNLESDSKSGLNLGIYFTFRPDKPFFFHVEGIGKGSFGAKGIKPYPTESDTLNNLFADGSVERDIQSFSLPILVRYKITSLFFAEAGIQPNMRLKVEDHFKTEVDGNDLEYKQKISKQFTTLDFGVAGGLFYRFNKKKSSMGLGIRYFQGLTDTYKSMAGNQVNTAWLINITVPVGAGKSGNPTAK